MKNTKKLKNVIKALQNILKIYVIIDHIAVSDEVCYQPFSLRDLGYENRA